MKEQSSLKDLAASGVKWRTLSTFISAALQLLQVVVLARLLSPGDFGLFAIAAVVVGLAQKVSDLGVPNAVIQRERPTQEELSSLYWLTIISGIGAFALVALSAPFIRIFYGGERLAPLLILYSITLAIAPVGLLPYALLQKEMRFKELARIDIVSAGAGAFVSILSAISGHGVYSFVWGSLASVAFTAFGSLAAKNGFTLRLKKSELRGYLGFGLYNTGEKAVSHLMWNMDKLIIGKLLGAEALGFYSVAFQLVTKPIELFSPAISGVSFPAFSLLQSDDRRLREAFLKVTRMASFLYAPLYIGMFAIAALLIDVLFGARWAYAAPLLQILTPVGFFWSVNTHAGGLLYAKGRADLGFWLNVLCLPVYAAALLIGSHWGIEGIAWGLTLTEAVLMQPLEAWLLYYIIRIRPLEYIGTFLPYLAISAAAMAGVLPMVNLSGTVNPALRLTTLLSAGAVFYLAGIWVFKRPMLREALGLLKAPIVRA